MISGNPSVKFELISQMIAQENNQMTVTELCAIAHVSRSGYYRWVDAAPLREEREKADQANFELILWAYQKRGYTKGARGIYMCLLHREPAVIMNLKKIRRLMDKYGLMCPIRKANPYRRMAKALQTSHVAQYLLERKFREFGPRMVLLTDITYIPYGGTFAYLSTILDAFTKQVLSYVLSDSLEVDFVLETVNQLIEKHGVSLKAETLINSDQGCHYTSYSFIQLIKDKGLRQSMSHRGNCWDNAPQESFFGHMKDHIMRKITSCTEFSQVQLIVDDYMDYYNKERYQWDLAKLSPDEFYQFVTTKVYPIDVRNPPSADSFLQAKPADVPNPMDHVE